MEDAACPKCKSTKYRNPSMKLMVNVCGHALCESCVELLFVKGNEWKTAFLALIRYLWVLIKPQKRVLSIYFIFRDFFHQEYNFTVVINLLKPFTLSISSYNGHL